MQTEAHIMEKDLPWVVVTAAGTDEQVIVGQSVSLGLALQLKAELCDPTSDVMKRMPCGQLTTEF